MSDKVIKIVNGQPEGYPIYLVNIIHTYPELEDGVTRDELLARGYDYVIEDPVPQSPFYKNIVQQPCQLIDGAWRVVWTFDGMTEEEKARVLTNKNIEVKNQFDQLLAEIQSNIDSNIDVEKWSKYKQDVQLLMHSDIENIFDMQVPVITNGIMSDVSGTIQGVSLQDINAEEYLSSIRVLTQEEIEALKNPSSGV